MRTRVWILKLLDVSLKRCLRGDGDGLMDK